MGIKISSICHLLNLHIACYVLIMTRIIYFRNEFWRIGKLAINNKYSAIFLKQPSLESHKIECCCCIEVKYTLGNQKRRQFAWSVRSYFLGKIRKNIISLPYVEFAQSKESVKVSITTCSRRCFEIFYFSKKKKKNNNNNKMTLHMNLMASMKCQVLFSLKKKH